MESLMNPADLDIPDPCNSSQEMSPITQDELLSQLAGKEIERLLAEVDQQLDAAMDEKQDQPAPALALRRYPRPQVPTLAESPDQAAGLAEMAAQERARQRRQIQIFAIDPADNEDVDHAIQEDDDMAVVGTPVDVFEDHELNGSLARTGTNYFADLEKPLPGYLKPLAWLNAPFEGMSQAALGALGKVAIVLFVSAIATLAYVIVLTRA
jgi:hypothetical protein